MCPEIAALRGLVDAFAVSLKPNPSNPARLEEWTYAARSIDLPHVRSFVRGIEQGRDAIVRAYLGR